MANTSTIDPTIPAANSPLTSAPIRAQFQAAINDINNIYNLIGGSVPNVVIWTGNPVNVGSTETSTVIRFTAPAPPNIQLPLATFIGEQHKVIDALGIFGSNNATVTALGGFLIGGQSSQVLRFNFGGMAVEWDGVGWNIIG